MIMSSSPVAARYLELTHKRLEPAAAWYFLSQVIFRPAERKIDLPRVRNRRLRKSYLQDLRGVTCNGFRLRQHGTVHCICMSVFALVERKNRHTKKITYRSAEGWIGDRVTPAIYTSYAAVASSCSLPAAAWYFPIFLLSFSRCERENDNNRKKSTALPKAMIAFDTQPRNACYLLFCVALFALAECKKSHVTTIKCRCEDARMLAHTS